MRLQELAKELGVTPNNLIKFFQDEGYAIKGALKTLSDDEIGIARKKLSSSKKTAEPAIKPSPKPQPAAGGATKKKVFIRKNVPVDARMKSRIQQSGQAAQIRPAQIPPKRVGQTQLKVGAIPTVKKKPTVTKQKTAVTIPEVKKPEVIAPPPEMKPVHEVKPSETPKIPQETKPVRPLTIEERSPREKIAPPTERPPRTDRPPPRTDRPPTRTDRPPPRTDRPNEFRRDRFQPRDRDFQNRRDPKFDKPRQPERPKFSKEDAFKAAREKRRAPEMKRPHFEDKDRTGVAMREHRGPKDRPPPMDYRRRKRGGPPPRDAVRDRRPEIKPKPKEGPKDIILEGKAFDKSIIALKGSFRASLDTGAAVRGKRKKKILPQERKRPKILKPGKRDESEYGGRSLLVKRHKKKKQPEKVPALSDIKTEMHKKIRVTDHMTSKDLSAVTGVRSPAIMKFLLDDLNLIVNINQVVDKDIAALVLENLGFEYEITIKEVEEVLKKTVDDRAEDLKRRSPVVTVLGHVDHGKTRLLDTIRRTNVAAHEAGGITQAIGAYQARVKDRAITFIDTPGHEAFTAMRARGAKVTDVAILVVACDDGVQPQTLEAIDHAKNAGIEIVVALNKIDLETSDPERVKGQLSEVGLIPEEWGGHTVMVPISAKFGQGIDELLELVLLQADLLDLKANPKAPAQGTIIEARIDRGKGAVATVLIQRGTLHVGDYVVVGCSYGRIRAMVNENGVEMKSAAPSVPSEIFGLSDVPQAGDILNQVENEKIAKDIYDKRCLDKRQERIRAVNKISLDELYKKIKEGETKELNLIIKADMQGSIEAIIHALSQLDNTEVQIKFIHSSVGNVKESDIMLAIASKSIILAFNVVVSAEMKKLATMEGIDIRGYNIIYKAVEDIEKAMKGLLEPEFKEEIIGTAEVRAIFKKAKGAIVAGAVVTSGHLKRGGDIRILRNNEKIWSGKLTSLKRFTDDAREVENGLECGIMLESITDLAEGDVIEEFEMVEIPRV